MGKWKERKRAVSGKNGVSSNDTIYECNVCGKHGVSKAEGVDMCVWIAGAIVGTVCLWCGGVCLRDEQ